MKGLKTIFSFLDLILALILACAMIFTKKAIFIILFIVFNIGHCVVYYLISLKEIEEKEKKKEKEEKEKDIRNESN